MAPDFTPRTTSTYDWEFAYKGQFRDAETGYYNYGYRYYVPTLGRWINRDPIMERGGGNLYGAVENRSVNAVDILGLACCPEPDGEYYDGSTSCCINGSIVSRSERITVRVCGRNANFRGGDTLGKFGLQHEFVSGPDGPPVGQGPVGTNGNPGPSYPGVRTELTDHSGEPMDDCEDVEVNRCAFYENTRPGTPKHRWIPGCNDCNNIANDIIRRSGGKRAGWVPGPDPVDSPGVFGDRPGDLLPGPKPDFDFTPANSP